MSAVKKQSPKPVAEVAEEACFQLGVARDYINWIGAVARAMALNATHGQDNFELVGLCQFLTDTSLPGIESSISEFAAMVPDSGGTAQ